MERPAQGSFPSRQEIGAAFALKPFLILNQGSYTVNMAVFAV